MRIFITFLILSLTQISYSQESHSSNQVIVKGTVKDDSGNFKDCEIEFKKAGGQKFVVKTKEGKFEQLVNAEEEYSLTFVGDDILRDEITVSFPKADKDFNPINREFEVFKLSSGKTLKDLDIFEDGSANLSSKGKKAIENLKTLLKFNRTLKLKLVCKGAGGLAAKREAALKEYTSSKEWRRFNRSASISSAEGSDDKKDLEVKISEIIDRMR